MPRASPIDLAMGYRLALRPWDRLKACQSLVGTALVACYRQASVGADVVQMPRPETSGHRATTSGLNRQSSTSSSAAWPSSSSSTGLGRAAEMRTKRWRSGGAAEAAPAEPGYEGTLSVQLTTSRIGTRVPTRSRCSLISAPAGRQPKSVAAQSPRKLIARGSAVTDSG